MMKKYDKYKYSGALELATVGRLNNLGRGRVISSIEIVENHGRYPVYSSQTENNGIMGYLSSCITLDEQLLSSTYRNA